MNSWERWKRTEEDVAIIPPRRSVEDVILAKSWILISERVRVEFANLSRLREEILERKGIWYHRTCHTISISLHL